MNKLKEINGKYYQEVEIVMLASNKTTTIFLSKDKLEYFKSFTEHGQSNLTKMHKSNHIKSQHLYFLSNEEIKEGELFIDLREKTLDEEDIYTAGFCSDIEFANKIGKKIIATTDISLLKSYSEQTLNDFACLPQPSKSFIQAFIAAYNEGKPITKVLVEMEGIGRMKSGGEFTPITSQLKVNYSNEITIKKVKDSWARGEVISFAAKLRWFINEGNKTVFEVDKWIEENL